jgi:hypothetical protein
VLMADVNAARTGVDTAGALGAVKDVARSCRTKETCIWCVSDPLQLEHGAKKGAAIVRLLRASTPR